MPKKSTMKKTALPVPQTQAGAEALIESIGRLQREVSRIETEMNDELATIKAGYQSQAAPLNEQIQEAFDAVHAWAEANRSTLLRGKLKTAKLATGEISWRTTPRKVVIRGADAVMDALARLAPQFIRTKREIDKDAILADPAAVEGVKGINFSQREEFRVVPFESEIERTVTQALQNAA